MKSARIGFSTLLSSLIAYHFIEQPAPVLLVLSKGSADLSAHLSSALSSIMSPAIGFGGPSSALVNPAEADARNAIVTLEEIADSDHAALS